jgi:hypothetical protein
MSLRPAEPQMTATPTLEDIEAFEQAHGFASFDRESNRNRGMFVVWAGEDG